MGNTDAAGAERSSFYVTTPIYYVNDAPHIGHAYTTVIADAVARWHRMIGDDTFFLTGTDEHGLKVQRAAEENGVAPREWADRTVERFREAWKLLNIASDDFIRTTEPRHYDAVTTFLQRVYDNGHIELGTYEGLYCVSCEAYYTVDELIDGELCPVHKRPVEEVKEENYFFKLSSFEQKLLDWYEANPDVVQPESKRNEALGFIRQGLQDFSISRTSISWGVPIPWDSNHVTYVWFDALTNYITAAGYGSDEERFARQWPATHLLGKDILRFHCVYWPAMLMAAGVEPPRNLFVHGFLLVGGDKMSKTAFNQITPADLTNDFGVDGFRYHFLRDVPFGPDGEFSYERMVDRYNSDLANNLGNLLSRVSAVVAKKCGGIGPAPRPDSPLANTAAQAYATNREAWASVQPSVALDATWQLIRETNAYLEANEPWKLEPGPEVEAIMGDALEALRIVTLLATPAIPETSAEIWQRIGLDGQPGDLSLPELVGWGGYPGGLEVSKGSPLFPRLQK